MASAPREVAAGRAEHRQQVAGTPAAAAGCLLGGGGGWHTPTALALGEEACPEGSLRWGVRPAAGGGLGTAAGVREDGWGLGVGRSAAVWVLEALAGAGVGQLREEGAGVGVARLRRSAVRRHRKGRPIGVEVASGVVIFNLRRSHQEQISRQLTSLASVCCSDKVTTDKLAGIFKKKPISKDSRRDCLTS